jgi:hypothetical protein
MKKYLVAFEQTGLTKETVSATLRSKIKKLEMLETACAEGEAEAASTKNVRAKAKLESQIAEARQTIDEMDTDIEAGIFRYKKNEATYRAAGAKLNNKGAVAPVTATPGTETETEESTEETTTTQENSTSHAEEVDETPVVTEVETPVVTEEKKDEKKGGNAWFLGGLVALALAAIGINYFDNK